MNSEDLERALSNGGSQKPSSDVPMSKEMEIGFHQGSLNTLVNERSELLKLVNITEQLIQAHSKRLEELGVKINFSDNSQGNK
jgi:hypothetical protein